MTAPSQMRIESFKSHLLRGNPLGDPHEREIPVYLPPDYEADQERRYPVAYLLPAYASNAVKMIHSSPWDESLRQRFDRLIRSGRMRPMIVVLPDCWTRYGGSQYLNSSATGRYQDFLIQELIPWVDTRFRTFPNRNYRAVLGISSGGYGATILGMRHPDVFGLIADHSGDKHFEVGYRPDFPKAMDCLYQAGGLEAFLQDFPQSLPRSSRWFDGINVIAMASCYSPNPDSPWGFELPFRVETGELREKIWEQWLEYDPVRQVELYGEALQSLRLLYFDCGSRDEYRLHWGARLFAHRLRQRGIPHEYEEFNGGHRGLVYRFDRSLQKISQAMPQEEA